MKRNHETSGLLEDEPTGDGRRVLMPCPFCGGTAKIIATTTLRAPWSSIGCDSMGFAPVCGSCGATMPSEITGIKAVAVWNRRV